MKLQAKKMRHSLLRYLAGQSLPATVAGTSGVAAVQALVQDGLVKAILPSIRSAAAQLPAATVIELTRLGLRELRRNQPTPSPQ